MTLLGWLTVFIVGTVVGELASPLLRNRFPLNIMQGSVAQPRSVLFVRMIFSTLLFGAIFGLFCGWALLAVRFFFPHLF